MTPSRELRRLGAAARRRLQRLHAHAARGAVIAMRRDQEAVMAFIIIELLSTWGNFCRAFYLSCAVRTTSTSGVRVVSTAGLTDHTQALSAIVPLLNRRAQRKPDGTWHRRDEPTWYDPRNLLAACNAIGCSKVTDVQAAVSSGSRVFLDLPVYRNFYAHRSHQTQRAASDLAPLYGIASTLRPTEILLTAPLGRYQPLILEWVDDIDLAIEYLCY